MSIADAPTMLGNTGDSSRGQPGARRPLARVRILDEEGEVLERGHTVGRYVVIERVGAGGMGVVYAAYDPQLDRKVALKLMHSAPSEATSAEEKARDDGHVRLLREAQAMAKLRHPNVITVHDVGALDDHQVFVAMEFIDGATLKDWLAREKPPRRRVLEVFVQAGRGLEAAHAAGLIHRDFKPENVLVDRGGVPRVLDFGLAKAVGELADESPGKSMVGKVPKLVDSVEHSSLSTSITRAGTVLGTPAYMAPEQHVGAETDARSDQFSFCVALYEALYGVLPYSGATIAAMAFAVLQGRVDEPPSGSRVSARLRRILLRGLSVEPEDRYPTMAELLAELSVDPWARRRRWLLGVFGLALAGLGTVAYLEARASRRSVCAGDDGVFAEVWDEPRKQAIERAFLETGRSFAEDTWARVEAMIDDYTAAWREMSRAACVATHVEHEQSPELLHLRMACLARRQSQVRALTDVFASADAGTVDKAITLVASLSSVGGCADTEALASEVLPPEDASTRAEVARLEERLDDARVQLGAGHYSEGLELATLVVQRARPLEYAPLVGQAELVRGQLLAELGETSAAAALELAITEASRGKDARGAAEAWIELIDVIGVQQAQFDRALAMRIAAEAALAWAGVGARDRALEARLARVSGEVLRMQGKLPEAESEARRAVSLIESSADRDASAAAALADTLMGLGRLLRTRGEYDEAKAAYRRARTLREDTLGAGHPDVASALTGLGNTAWAAGQYAEARSFLERALAIRVKALGARHPKVATTENSLGAVYQTEGRYEEAEEHFRKALAIREAELGLEHPQVAATRMNIGNTLIQRGDLEGARAQYEQALAAQRQKLGEKHPDIAYTLNNLGLLASRLRRYDEAESYYRKALAVREEALGAEHPDTASNLDSLGIVLVEIGPERHDEAAELLERSLRIRERALGAEHPDVASSLQGLGTLDLARARPVGAQARLERALVIAEKALPPTHHFTTATLVGLAKCRLALKDVAGAVIHLERALSLRTQDDAAAPGAQGSDLEEARFLLAKTLWSRSAGAPQRARARALAEQARDGYAALDGPTSADARAEVERWLQGR